MGNLVFANGREVSCKAADGKSICAFPDVCLSPPSPPAGPIPIPYPNTGFASDTADGSKTVMISGQEVMLKDKSYFKKSTGDEAATKTLGMGVVTHQITGKVYFNSWSMDVKVEGENVVRFMDLTTHNHASVPGNSPTWPYIDKPAIPASHPCAKDAKKEADACKEFTPHGGKDACKQRQLPRTKPSRRKASPEADRLADKVAANECLAARRCFLQPYDPSGCCDPQTPHHLIEASALHDTGRGGKGSIPLAGISNYKEGKAPCVCAEGPTQNVGTHGVMHTFQSASAANAKSGTLALSSPGKSVTGKKTTYGKAKKNSLQAMRKAFPQSKCKAKCVEAQLDSYHKQCGMSNGTPIKAVETGQGDVAAVQASVTARTARLAGRR
jgi:hypothetical protein